MRGLCKECGKEFSFFKSEERIFCSKECYQSNKRSLNEFISGDESYILIKSKKYGSFKVLVDCEDIKKVSKYNWFIRKASKTEKIFYVETFDGKHYSKRKVIKLHRYITKCPDGLVVDHINRDTLDNRKSNLRICSQAENMQNRKIQSNNKCGSKNISVTRDKYGEYFLFSITRNKKTFKKRFQKIEDAIEYKEQYMKERDLI